MSIEDLSEEDLELVGLIADAVTERLHKSLLHLPPHVAEDLKPHAGAWSQLILPATRDATLSYALRASYLTDGGIELQLIDFNGQTAWRGVLSA